MGRCWRFANTGRTAVRGMLTKIRFERFTAFENLVIAFSPGINIFIGKNGTGKTHVLKAAYAACDAINPSGNFPKKINDIFFPSGKKIGRLVKRMPVSTRGLLEITRENSSGNQMSVRLSMSNHTSEPDKTKLSGRINMWKNEPLKSVFIPVKDMLANSRGFASLYSQREVHFEEVYLDIIQRALLPNLKGPVEIQRRKLLHRLRQVMEGSVVVKNDEFFLKNKHGTLEFTLLAEGYRKLGLLWSLIQNGTLLGGSVLFWDEPETNLNPVLLKTVITILLELQRMGVQIFVATHNFVVLKEFDIQANAEDRILYHSLFHNPETGTIEVKSTEDYLYISPNAIDQALEEMTSRAISKTMGGLGK